jgi:voltage-gated potassium channel
MAIIDLMATLPFYIPMIIPMDLRFVRALRLFRLFRFFKLARYSHSMKTIVNVVKSRKEDLLITLSMVIILLIFASSLLYYAEKDIQPDKFTSIPSSMWWGVATLTTVGYGDIFPVTPIGKVFSSIIAIIGIGLFALPTGILASAFSDEMQRQRDEEKELEKEQQKHCCPHCGKELP